MNPIKRFFLFIYKDLKSDVETVFYIGKQLKNGKPILDPEKKRIAIAEMKKVPKALLKESWPWLLAIVFTFSMGYLVGLEKCEIACNNFMIENMGDQMIINRTDRLLEGIANQFNYTSPIVSPNISILNGNNG